MNARFTTGLLIALPYRPCALSMGQSTAASKLAVSLSCSVMASKQSINQSINQLINQNLYSAPSRSLLRGAPDPAQAKKKA